MIIQESTTNKWYLDIEKLKIFMEIPEYKAQEIIKGNNLQETKSKYTPNIYWKKPIRTRRRKIQQ